MSTQTLSIPGEDVSIREDKSPHDPPQLPTPTPREPLPSQMYKIPIYEPGVHNPFAFDLHTISTTVTNHRFYMSKPQMFERDSLDIPDVIPHLSDKWLEKSNIIRKLVEYANSKLQFTKPKLEWKADYLSYDMRQVFDLVYGHAEDIEEIMMREIPRETCGKCCRKMSEE